MECVPAGELLSPVQAYSADLAEEAAEADLAEADSGVAALAAVVPVEAGNSDSAWSRYDVMENPDPVLISINHPAFGK